MKAFFRRIAAYFRPKASLAKLEFELHKAKVTADGVQLAYDDLQSDFETKSATINSLKLQHDQDKAKFKSQLLGISSSLMEQSELAKKRGDEIVQLQKSEKVQSAHIAELQHENVALKHELDDRKRQMSETKEAVSRWA